MSVRGYPPPHTPFAKWFILLVMQFLVLLKVINTLANPRAISKA